MAINLIYVPWATPLEIEEVDGLIPGHISTQWQLDEWETVNVSKWMQWGRRARLDIFTEQFCRKFHKEMFGNTWKWAWEFRKSDKNIGCPWSKIGLELRETLDTAKYWVENRTFPIHEIAIRFHHRLVSIHPFPNGNGRFSRAMADILLLRAKETPLAWNSFGNLSNANEIRKDYITALKKADNGDYSDLVQLCSPKK